MRFIPGCLLLLLLISSLSPAHGENLVTDFWTEVVFRHFFFSFQLENGERGAYELGKKLLTVARFLKVRYLRIQLLEAFVLLWLLAVGGGVWMPTVPVTHPWLVYSWPFSDAALLSLILSRYLSFALPVSATPAWPNLWRDLKIMNSTGGSPAGNIWCNSVRLALTRAIINTTGVLKYKLSAKKQASTSKWEGGLNK